MKMIRSGCVGMVLAATCFLNATTSFAVPFQNGSFETGPSISGNYSLLFSGNSSINGWEVGSGSIDYIGSYWTSGDGSRSLDLSGNGAGSIFQDFDTVSGASYDAMFALAGNPGGTGPVIKNLRVEVLDGASSIFNQTYTFDTAGKTESNMGWTDINFGFTAISASSRIFFTSLNSTDSGPALDNVRITQASVPEPSVLILMGLGLAGISYKQLRSKKAT